jgi:hypothetical protein
MRCPPAWARAGTQLLATPCIPKNPATIMATPQVMASSEPDSVTRTPAALTRQLAGTTERREKRSAIRPASGALRLPTG